MRTLVLITALCVLPVGSFSQEVDETCEGTTYDVATCALRILKKVESELSQTYQRASKTANEDYTPRDMENLRVVQRRWIAYRDAACRAEHELWGGGSGGPSAHTDCLIRIDRQRITELKNAYGVR